jgi:hypothetical protein
VREPVPLRLYSEVSALDRLDWSEVEARLAGAGTYWVCAVPDRGAPHPRPVWGCWLDETLSLTLGSPVVRRQLDVDPTVTVTLDSGTDPVILEGRFDPGRSTDPSSIEAFVSAYDAKYDWAYDVARYGPPHVVVPHTVVAWRTAGFAGRDSFQSVGRWRFS